MTFWDPVALKETKNKGNIKQRETVLKKHSPAFLSINTIFNI